MEKSINIPGIDISKVLDNFNGNQDNFLKVLRSYLAGTKTKLELLKNYSKENLKSYEIAVHGVKGTSNSICAEDIGRLAAELEKAAVAGNIDFIDKNNPIMLEKLKGLLKYLEEMFANIDSLIVKEKKDKPDVLNLKKLMEACEIYDMMEVDAAIEEINSFIYDSDDGLVEWLKQKAEEMNYEAITEKLSPLVN